MPWQAAGKHVRLPRGGGKTRAIGYAEIARTTITAVASGVTGHLAPAMIGVAVAATSTVAIGKFAIGMCAASLGRYNTNDGVSSVEKVDANMIST